MENVQYDLLACEAVSNLMKGLPVIALPFFNGKPEVLYPHDFRLMPKQHVWQYLRKYNRFGTAKGKYFVPKKRSAPKRIADIISLQ